MQNSIEYSAALPWPSASTSASLKSTMV